MALFSSNTILISTLVRKAISVIILMAFISTSIKVPAFAQAVDPMPQMPMPGVIVHLSPEFTPAYLKGIVIHPENALKFDFIIYKGDKALSDEQKREEYTKLTKYFLASLAIPDDDQWVNLSPYEKDRIIKEDFGKTEMGRDLLAQDYMLKQITASLIYPEDNLGKKFWNRVYDQAQKQYGTTDIPVNTFNKVWILPDDALIYEKDNTAYVLKNHLRVMLEEDYLSLQKHSGIDSAPVDNDTHTIASKIVKEIVLPELQREVNEGENFAAVRQVYSGMLLATWYKRALKESLLGRIYANQARVKGVDQDPANNEKIYRQYLRAYKKGVFNYIKEDVDKYTNETIPRKYFSGGGEGYKLAEETIGTVIHTKSQVTPAEQAMISAQENDVDDFGVATEEQDVVNVEQTVVARKEAEQGAMSSQKAEEPQAVAGGGGGGKNPPTEPPANDLTSLLQERAREFSREATAGLSAAERQAGERLINELPIKSPAEVSQEELERQEEAVRRLLERSDEFPPVDRLDASFALFPTTALSLRTRDDFVQMSKEFATDCSSCAIVTAQNPEAAPFVEAGIDAALFSNYAQISSQRLGFNPTFRQAWSRTQGFFGLDNTTEHVPQKVRATMRAWVQAVHVRAQAILQRILFNSATPSTSDAAMSGKISFDVDRENSSFHVGRVPATFPPPFKSRRTILLKRDFRKFIFITDTEGEGYRYSFEPLKEGESIGYGDYKIGEFRFKLSPDGVTILYRNNEPPIQGSYVDSPEVSASDKAKLNVVTRQLNETNGYIPTSFERIIAIKTPEREFAILAFFNFQGEKKYSFMESRDSEPVDIEKGTHTDGGITYDIQDDGINIHYNPQIQTSFTIEDLAMSALEKRNHLVESLKRLSLAALLIAGTLLPAQVSKANPIPISPVTVHALSPPHDPYNLQDHNNVGGIDFNSANLKLQIRRDGKGVPLPISQQDLENIKIDGLVPIVIYIRPAKSLPIFSQLQSQSSL